MSETSVVFLEVGQRLVRGGLLDHRHRRHQVVVLVLLFQQWLQSYVTTESKWVKEVSWKDARLNVDDLAYAIQ